jgi:hypothetical protein
MSEMKNNLEINVSFSQLEIESVPSPKSPVPVQIKGVLTS